MRRAARALLLLSLPLASALRVKYTMQTAQRLAALQDFGSHGGTVVTNLSVTIPYCSYNGTGRGDPCSWDTAAQLYLVVLTSDQLRNMTRSVTRIDTTSTFQCRQPSMVRRPVRPAPPSGYCVRHRCP